VRDAIETLVESGDIDDDACDAWREKKRALDLKRAQELFDEDRVMDAAKMGLSKAQGVMANRYFNGSDGEEKDLDKCFEWATKAARGGDMLGQLLGCAYYEGEGCGTELDRGSQVVRARRCPRMRGGHAQHRGYSFK